MSENPYAGQGSVLLDIGGNIGALVVTMPAELEGVEVEINRLDARGHDHHDDPHDHGHDHRHDHGHDGGHAPDHGGGHTHDHAAGPHRPHVAVVARPAPTGQIIYSLVFPELTEGRYELYRRPSGPVELRVTVRGGEVTHEAWPGTARR